MSTRRERRLRAKAREAMRASLHDPDRPRRCKHRTPWLSAYMQCNRVGPWGPMNRCPEHLAVWEAEWKTFLVAHGLPEGSPDA